MSNLTSLQDLKQLCDQDAYLELHPKTKLPVAKGWPNQGQPASVVIRKGNNIGLILGKPSDLLDVDLDCREAKNYWQI